MKALLLSTCNYSVSIEVRVFPKSENVPVEQTTRLENDFINKECVQSFKEMCCKDFDFVAFVGDGQTEIIKSKNSA